MTNPDLDSAYALRTPEDNLRLYAAWAETYDSGFADSHHYVLPLRVAEAYVQAGGRAPVIDLGAGTGLCGAALRALGVAPVEATDLSQEMLDVAARKGIYSRLYTGNLLDRLPIAEAAYAGAVSSGTFTHGHVGPEALDEVLRVVRRGGVVALSINAEHWQAQGFADRFAALADRIADLVTRDLPIYGPDATGPHAGDLSRIVTFTRV